MSSDATSHEDEGIFPQNPEPENPSRCQSCCHSLSSCCSMTSFFTKHSARDICRNKLNFCLAFCSVLVVVLTTLVIKSVTN